MKIAGAVDQAESSDAARHIARTAAGLFARRGYDATSVRSIVEAAGVTKPTLYYHFGSKEGLAQALLHRPLTGLVATLSTLADEEGDPVARLERIVEAHFDFCREEPDRARFYYALCIGPHASDLSAELVKYGPRLDAPIARVIAALVEAGRVPEARAHGLLRACRGLITALVMSFLYRDNGDGALKLDPETARQLVDDLLYGFARTGRDGRETRE